MTSRSPRTHAACRSLRSRCGTLVRIVAVGVHEISPRLSPAVRHFPVTEGPPRGRRLPFGLDAGFLNNAARAPGMHPAQRFAVNLRAGTVPALTVGVEKAQAGIRSCAPRRRGWRVSGIPGRDLLALGWRLMLTAGWRPLAAVGWLAARPARGRWPAAQPLSGGVAGLALDVGVFHAADPLIRAANVSAAARWLPGMTCAYTVRVTVGLACPSRSDTTLTGTPAASSSDACVCL